MNLNYKILILLIVLIFGSKELHAQRIGISTNLIGIATLSPNLGLEIIVSNKSTLSLDASFAPWHITHNLSLRHLSISPEYKYWFKQAMYSHYIGTNALYSTYKFHINDRHYEGIVICAGITYGYSFIIGRRWNIIPAIGVGVGANKDYIANKTKIVPALTKFDITLQYIIK